MQSYHLKQISSIWTLQDLYFINVKSLLYQTLIIDLDFSLLSNNLPASDFYSLYLMHWRANVVKESTPAIEIQKSLRNGIVFKKNDSKKWLKYFMEILLSGHYYRYLPWLCKNCNNMILVYRYSNQTSWKMCAYCCLEALLTLT